MQLSVLHWFRQQQQNSIPSPEVRLMFCDEDSTGRGGIKRKTEDEWHDTCAVLIKAEVNAIVAAVMPGAPSKRYKRHQSRMPSQAWTYTFKLILHYTSEHTHYQTNETVHQHSPVLFISIWSLLMTLDAPTGVTAPKWLLPLIASKTQFHINMLDSQVWIILFLERNTNKNQWRNLQQTLWLRWCTVSWRKYFFI